MPKPLRRRCDARLPARAVARDRAMRAGEPTKFLRRNRCRNWALTGSKRCRLHGGRSTGPTTPDGKARTVAAMKAGRARWLAQLKSEGKPIPCGRKKGGRNLPAEEREQIACEKRRLREGRAVLHQIRAERKARAGSERPVAKWKIMHGGRLARMLACAIGPRKNWRTFDSALIAGRFSLLAISATRQALRPTPLPVFRRSLGWRRTRPFRAD